jgi:enoyl-CoA hydratase/carnithine racemase
MSAILYDSRDGIAEITINQSEKYNILTHEVVAELHDAWVRFNESSDRVAILTGAGDKAFTAGANLKDDVIDFLNAARMACVFGRNWSCPW